MRCSDRAGLSALLLVATWLAWPSPSAAQPVSPERDARLTGIFADMSPGSSVRVTTPTLFIDEGSFRTLEADVVQIQYGESVVPVSLEDIRTVLVEARHPVKGALWGLGVGALVGSVTGLMVGGFGCTTPEGCASTEHEGAIRWGSVFGVAGAIGGFVIGRYSVYWKPVFP